MKKLSNIRSDFPILDRTMNGSPLVYFDNAATTQKPYSVIKAVSRFYAEQNANVERGVHTLGAEATELFERSRSTVANFLHAENDEEIVFTWSTTGAINLVAQSFVAPRIGPDDEVLVTEMEHHSNFVPWQRVCERAGATLRVLPMRDDGTLNVSELDRYLSENTVLFSLSHVSNTLGSIHPIKQCIEIAHQHDVPVCIDGAQAVSHIPVNVQELDCDFYAFSAHKMFGPTGIGCLYVKKDHFSEMEPYETGGGMVTRVTKDETSFRNPPKMFEAGTPHIAGVVGLMAAIEYIESIGFDAIADRERMLADDFQQKLTSVEGVRMFGAPEHRVPIFSFVFDDIHPHDLGTLLDEHGVAVRSGQHCTQLIMDYYNIPATTRASLAFYNTRQEIDVFIDALIDAKETFSI